jgi:hypothetical protein
VLAPSTGWILLRKTENPGCRTSLRCSKSARFDFSVDVRLANPRAKHDEQCDGAVIGIGLEFDGGEGGIESLVAE